MLEDEKDSTMNTEKREKDKMKRDEQENEMNTENKEQDSMKRDEQENEMNTENKEKNSMEEGYEKVHYEIKFVETEDGYRLEASGDKEALKRLGIGPRMVGRGRGRRQNGAQAGTRGRRMRRRVNHRAAAARRRRAMRQAWIEADPGQPHPRCDERQAARRGTRGHGRHPGMRGAHAGKGSHETWDW